MSFFFLVKGVNSACRYIKINHVFFCKHNELIIAIVC